MVNALETYKNIIYGIMVHFFTSKLMFIYKIIYYNGIQSMGNTCFLTAMIFSGRVIYILYMDAK